MIQNTSIQRQVTSGSDRLLGGALLGLAAGLVAGLAAGIAARVAMRAIALWGGQQPAFTLEGTLLIIGIGALIGLWPGLLYGFVQSFLPGSVPVKGTLFGLMLALLIAVPILLSDPTGELALVPKATAAAVFAAVPLVYGLVLGLVAGRLAPEGGNLPVESRRLVRTAGLLVLVGGLIGALVEVVLALTYPALGTLGFAPTHLLEDVAGGVAIFVSFIGIVGLMRSGATGKSSAGKLGLIVALLGVDLLVIVSMYENLNAVEPHGLARLMERLNYREDGLLLLVPILFGILGLPVAGTAVVRSRRWEGWRRVTPLLVGLVLITSILILYPLSLPLPLELTTPARNEAGHWLGATFALSWLAVGLALWVESGRRQKI